ncbi:MAG TPA: HlyD family secretion protein [Bryobacteraceae bacterium]|nr:HlyD family secretion protein [Bryobacteraceae bacterium]
MGDTIVAQNRAEAPPSPPSGSRPRRRRRWTIPALIVVLIALGVGGYLLWKYFGSYESTDDAQIDGHVDAISARINGHVSEVLVEDAQVVKAGDVLVRIDPRDYQVAVAQAEANVADAEASLRSSRTDVPIVSTNTASNLETARASRVNADAGLAAAQRQMDATQAALETAQAQVNEAQAIHKKDMDDAERFRLLVVKDEIPKQQYDQTVQTVAADEATVDARLASVNQARHNIAAAQAAVQEAQSRIPQAEASIQSAMTRPQQMAQSQDRARSAEAKVKQQQALLDQARLNLSYTVIYAPYDGIVGKKTVEVGENVSPGQSLMSVVPLEDIWVTANFKETQLKMMRPGQKVVFSVDAYDRDYHGHVTGVGGATGARFSLLPPENATGNYVKVVQRIPVRIDLDPGENRDHLLRVGMSLEPKVYLTR